MQCPPASETKSGEGADESGRVNSVVCSSFVVAPGSRCVSSRARVCDGDGSPRGGEGPPRRFSLVAPPPRRANPRPAPRGAKRNKKNDAKKI